MTDPSSAPKNITDEQLIDALTKSAGIITHAAEKLGISHQAVSERLRRHAHLREVQEQQKTRLIDIAEGHLVKGVVKGDWEKVRYFLDAQGRDRGYGRVEHTGPGGRPLFDVDDFLKGLPDAALHRLDASAARAMGPAGEGSGPPDED